MRKIGKRQLELILFLFFLVFAVSLLVSIIIQLFDIPRAPLRHGLIASLIADKYSRYFCQNPPVKDLMDLEIFQGQLHYWPCAPKDGPFSNIEYLVIYNPEYKTTTKDWILIVISEDDSAEEYGPIVLWSDNYGNQRSPNATDFICEKADLKLYYFDKVPLDND